jgi:transglutaminase-like putative cysteine protease
VGTTPLLLAVLLLGLGSVALGVADRVRGVEATLAVPMAVLGLLAGWTMSAIGLERWAAGLVTVAAGAAVVFARVGRLGGTLVRLSPAWIKLVRSVPQWLWRDEALTWGPTWVVLSDLGQDSTTLLARMYRWVMALVAGTPSFDPVAVAFVWSVGLWAVSGWAGWLTYRRERSLWALVPAGVLLMAAFSHVWGSHVFLLMLLLAGFLLMALTSYDCRVGRWEATGVDYPELRLETTVVTVFLSVALVTTAYVVPSISLERIVELAREIGGERSEEARALAESLGMEQRERTVFEEIRRGGLPRRHLLGTGPELSEQVVMFISTGDLPPGPPEAADREPPRYAWRSYTYDQYIGSGWQTGDTETMAYAAGVPAITQTLATERVVRQEVRVVGDAGDLLHAAGTLKVADHDYWVAWRAPEDPFGATIQARSYQADSLLPVVNEERLRADGSDYPAWVRERYLALPESVPQRVLGLARDLTATEPTPYGRARAIETYLRRFPYSLDVPLPPSGRDVVDYFLFDLQKGYCGYYASAMTVLARAAGLPARLAEGYASGTYDWESARYVVTEADAHAWPEVYFPDHGWVRFEPTAALPRAEHADEEGSRAWAEPEGELEPARSGWGFLRWTWWQGVIGGLSVVGLAAAAWWALDRRRLLRQRPGVALASLYKRLRRHGRRLEVPMQPGDTPHEFGRAFANWVEGVVGGRSPDQRVRWSGRAGQGRVRAAIAAAAEELLWLTALYARVSYSPRSPDAGEQARAVRLWGRLRWRLLLARLWQRAPVRSR